MEFLFHILNGISYGMLLFIMAAGFTIILGTLGIVNIAHGIFYLLAVYIGYTVMVSTGSFLLMLVASVLSLGVVGILVQRFLLNRFPLQQSPQVLLTFGIVLMLSEGCKMIWGANPLIPPKPGFLSGSLEVGGFIYPHYRIGLIVAGGIIAILLGLLQEKTKWGAIGRALRDDAEMTSGIGINISNAWVILFGMGCMLLGLAGAVGGHFVPASLIIGWQILLMCFVVVAMGGIGSLKGALVASLIVGILDNTARALLPELAMFFVFALLAIVLSVRPLGFFGKPLLIAGRRL